MKKALIYTFMILAVAVTAAGSLKGQSGKETRNVSDFSEISFGIAGNLYVKLGGSFSVVLEGDSRYINDVETYVRNGKLIIRQDNFRIFNYGKLDCYITMPSIKGLDVSGSGKARIEDAVKAEAFRLSVSGSGDLITGDVSADSFYCTISGSGSVNIEGQGSADKGNITISGSGGYDGANFEIDNLTVNVSGSGSCNCKAGDSLSASVSGSGNVWYSGNPRLNAHSSGSGKVRSK